MELTVKEKVQQGKGQFINGSWEQGTGLLRSINPATGQCFWEGDFASSEQVLKAVELSEHAMKHWMKVSFTNRIQLLKRFAEEVKQRMDELSFCIAMETGKPLWESRTEVSSVIAKIDLSIEAYHDRTGESHFDTNGVQSSLRFKPHGPVVVLGAFNFPAHISNGHIVPALLAGNTVIYKPSELTPAVAEMIMECWQAAGLPNGVIQCVQGEADVARLLLSQEAIKGVFFTGSYQTGRAIHQQFAGHPEVILALEMGGNNPLVLGNTENLSAAVYNSLLSGYITAGQRCTCARRLFIPDNAQGDQFLKQLTRAAQNLKVGPYTNTPEPFYGSIISNEHAKNHIQAQQALLERGGEALLAMELLAENSGLLSPGLIDMTNVSEFRDEEIFAPLMQVYRYSSFEEAINLANQTKYGLAAGLLSDDAKQYQQFYTEIHAGLVNWNRPTTGASSKLPFGGVGFSGNHRPSAWFAADYCAYPVASQEQTVLSLPESLLPGVGDLNAS